MTRKTDSMMVALTATVLLAVWASPAAADPQGVRMVPAPGMGLAALADEDADGAVSLGEWEALLARLDADGDGEVPLGALAALLPDRRAAAGHPLARALHEVDRDGSGQIEPEEMDDLFARLDRNGDGAIERAEVARGSGEQRVHPRHGGRLAMKLLHEADGDGDQLVTDSEWFAMVTRLTDPQTGAVDAPRVIGFGAGERAARRAQGREQLLLQRLDRDGDGAVDLDDLRVVFDDLDHDRDGRLTAAETAGTGRHRMPAGI